MNDGLLKEDKEKKKKKKGDSDESVAIEGTWSFEVEIPGDSQSGTLLITGSGDDVNVKVINSDAPDDVIDATNVDLEENNLTFDISVDGMSFSIDISFEGIVFEGAVTVPQAGSFPMTGSKKESPE